MAKTTDNVPAWQFNCIPGNANQGAVLMTRNDITNPPFNQSDFIWWAMEDIIGVANMKLEYDEEENLYKLYKATGHRDNEGNWTYDWEFVGDWAALTEEVVDILRLLNYVEYIYDTSIPNTLKVTGVNKDGTRDLLCDIHFASTQYVDNAVNGVQTALNNEITRATQREDALSTNLSAEIARATARENEIDHDLTDEVSRAVHRELELEEMIRQATINPGVAIEVVGTDNQVNVKYDNDSIKVNGSNQLKADVFDDTQVRNDKGWSSAKITQQLTSAMTYEGQVATYNDLPTGLGVDDKGKTYNVVNTGDNYTWNGTDWDNLSGEYIAGVGIRIQGKVISATGIAFNVGNGLESYPIGESDTGLKTKIGHGLEYDTNFANKVKGGNGIDVNANGVNVTTGDTTQIISDKVEVKPHNGLVNSTDGLDINANFNVKSTPLGTDSSKLAIYSDGKIGVDFTESPVVLAAEYLGKVNYAVGTNYSTNFQIPNYDDYDMFLIEPYVADSSGTSSGLQTLVIKGTGTTLTNQYINNGIHSMNGNTPRGCLLSMILFQNTNWTTGIIGRISTWSALTFLSGSQDWSPNNTASTNEVGVKFYGMKAR